MENGCADFVAAVNGLCYNSGNSSECYRCPYYDNDCADTLDDYIDNFYDSLLGFDN